MSKILYGSQTYPWQMSVERYHGQVPHFVDVLLKAGFTGIEAEIVMLGEYYGDWGRLKALLDERNVSLAAIAFHEDWLHMKETDEEFERANECIEFLAHFPAAKLMLGHVAAMPEREKDLRLKQDCQIACIDAIGRRAAERGVVSVFHPNSAPNSIFRYTDDYEYLLERLEKSPTGFAPDVGHMVNGGIDALRMIRNHRAKVAHVHFKDMAPDHEWATMGSGVIDFRAIIDYLKETDYRGWIMTEDESPDAVRDPDSVVLADGAFIQANR